MKNILFIAPPAGGKGTQSARLVENFGYIHISTGDLLRALDKTSELGKLVDEIISQGKFVSDEIVLELLKNKLLTLKKDDSFILDGFPRNLRQAEMLDELLDSLGISLDLVIELDVSYDIALKRAVGRVSCSECKTTYNKFFIPTKIEGVCDICGSELTKRSDDTEETYKNRFDAYVSMTMPLIDYYKNTGKYIKIDGINNTYETLLSVINND